MIVECPGCHLRYDVTGRPPATKGRCRCGVVFRLPDPPQQAGALACPRCAAPCDPASPRCDHCQTVLATVRCPRCFGLLFAGAKHCGHCGARVDAPAHAMPGEEHAARECPRCATALVANLVGDVLIDQCNDCGGLWVDQTAFERVLEAPPTAQAQLAAFPVPQTFVSPSKVTYIKCPDCDVVMNRHNFGRRSGIIVDVCKAHGIWFDHDELPRIVEFVRAGGLEEARRRELEELREQARNERQKLTAAHLRAQRAGLRDEPVFARRGGGIAEVAGILISLFK